jgi:hypothetical protein
MLPDVRRMACLPRPSRLRLADGDRHFGCRLAAAGSPATANLATGSPDRRSIRHIALSACWPRPLHQAQDGPKSPCAGMTLYQVLHELQLVLAVILGACPLCRQPVTLDRLAAALDGT